MKKILLACSILLLALPVGAHDTKPGDVVSVESTTIVSDDKPPTAHSIYSKPWSQIHIDPATVKRIDSILARYQITQGSTDKFRIAHLNMINNQVGIVLLLNNTGTAVAVNLMSGKYCYASADGQDIMAQCGR